MDSLSDFLITFIVNFFQVVWLLFGMVFIMGMALYLLSKFTRKVFVKSGYPKADIFITGWIGVPVHEIGHAVFCLIFRHKIKEIALFKPNKAEGTLGYVTHSFDPKNLYHIVGNFFIGCGPILFGSFVLWVLTLLLLQDSISFEAFTQKTHFDSVSFGEFLSTVYNTVSKSLTVFKTFVLAQDASSLQFWIYLYVASAISSHMQLSLPDIKTMGRGFLVILAVLFIILIMTGVWEFPIVDWIASTINLGFVYGILFYAICISAINFAITYVLFGSLYLFSKKEFLNPFVK